MALFGNTATLSSSRNLVEFRAGKMNLRGTTVTADKRKGLLYIYQSDDSLMHFCWKDRTAGTVEDDLIIFPDDIEFKKLAQCTTGRAFILKFKSSTRKFFFWMQEPKEDKDEEHCKKVNELLNNPPAPGSQAASGGAGGAGGATGLPGLASLGDQLDPNLQNLLQNMDQNQLMQLLGMGGGAGGGASGFEDALRSVPRGASQRASSQASSAATTSAVQESTPSPASTTPAASTRPSTQTSSSGVTGARTTPQVQLSDLQSILSNMQVPAAAAAQQTESVDLATSFSTDALLPLMADKDVQERLKPFLPAVENLPSNETELRNTLTSPQFKQALSIFSAALSSGELATLMQQFKLSQAAVEAAGKGDVLAFVKALQESEQQDDSTAPDVEDMALD